MKPPYLGLSLGTSVAVIAAIPQKGNHAEIVLPTDWALQQIPLQQGGGVDARDEQHSTYLKHANASMKLLIRQWHKDLGGWPSTVVFGLGSSPRLRELHDIVLFPKARPGGVRVVVLRTESEQMRMQLKGGLSHKVLLTTRCATSQVSHPDLDACPADIAQCSFWSKKHDTGSRRRSQCYS